MAVNQSTTKLEIQSSLEIILDKENVKNISVDILGNSEKGDGYMGDIIFASVKGTTEDGSTKKYNLVLKCSKRSEVLRKTAPVKEAFVTEIHMYNTVFPVFTQFQLEKGIAEPFSSIPMCYGTFTTENTEIIALEDLKKSGYILWNKRKPLTRNHINMVVKEYGKLHAISVAMSDQQPKKFQELTEGLGDAFQKFVETGDMQALYGPPIDDAYEVLANELDENTLSKWKNLKLNINHYFDDFLKKFEGMRVIIHGDCWNNNFMFYSDVNDDELPTKVAILDWQISRLSSPIIDLSYFLFACISVTDIEDLQIILEEYYRSFSNYLRKLGSNPETLYPEVQFLKEWKRLSKYGIYFSSLITKITSADKDEVPDIVHTAENGGDFATSFIFDIKDKEYFKKRMKYIVKYVVENNLI